MLGALTGARSPRALRRFGVVPLVLLLLLSVAPAASASSSFWSSVPAYPIPTADKCVGRDGSGNPSIPWRGGEPGTVGGWPPETYQPHGTMYLCYTAFRLGKKAAGGDYYAIVLRTVWQAESCPYFSCQDWYAPMTQSVFSSIVPIDGRYDWTDTHTSTTSCGTAWTIGLSAGPISASTDLRVCKGYTVKRHYQISRGAGWSSNYAGKLRTVDTAYMQKVPHGSVPTWDILFAVPYFRYEQVGSTTWEISKSWKHYHYSPTGTV